MVYYCLSMKVGGRVWDCQRCGFVEAIAKVLVSGTKHQIRMRNIAVLEVWTLSRSK
jgi:hypothetical protein